MKILSPEQFLAILEDERTIEHDIRKSLSVMSALTAS